MTYTARASRSPFGTFFDFTCFQDLGAYGKNIITRKFLTLEVRNILKIKDALEVPDLSLATWLYLTSATWADSTSI